MDEATSGRVNGLSTIYEIHNLLSRNHRSGPHLDLRVVQNGKAIASPARERRLAPQPAAVWVLPKVGNSAVWHGVHVVHRASYFDGGGVGRGLLPQRVHAPGMDRNGFRPARGRLLGNWSRSRYRHACRRGCPNDTKDRGADMRIHSLLSPKCKLSRSSIANRSDHVWPQTKSARQECPCRADSAVNAQRRSARRDGARIPS